MAHTSATARSFASAALSQSLSSAIVHQTAPAIASRYLNTTCRFLPRYARPQHGRPSFLQQRQAANSTLALYQVPSTSITHELSTLQRVLKQRYLRVQPNLINITRRVRETYWYRYSTRLARKGLMWWTKRLAINLVIDGLLFGWLAMESAQEESDREKEAEEWWRRSDEAEERNQREYETWLGKMSLAGNWG